MKALLLALLLLPSPARAEDGLSRVRLTETSITERGRIEGNYFRMKTKGFGLGYIASCGFGAHLTSLTTKGEDEGAGGLTFAELKHTSLDASYTHGFLDGHLLLTGGVGLGLGGSAKTTSRAAPEARETKDFQSKTWFLGPGFSLGFFEVYWIHRRNYLSYDGGDLKMESQHYQLGLGAHFAL